MNSINLQDCSQRKSKNRPETFSKAELIKLGINLLGLTSVVATKKSKTELCKLLLKKKDVSDKTVERIILRKLKGKKDVEEKKQKKTDIEEKKQKKTEKKLKKLGFVEKRKSPQKERKSPKKERKSSKKSPMKKSKQEEKKLKMKTGAKPVLFFVTKCAKYSDEEIKKFAKVFSIPYDSSREKLCKQLIDASLKSKWERCLHTKKEVLEKLAKRYDLPIDGSRQDLCKRLRDHHIHGLEKHLGQNFLEKKDEKQEREQDGKQEKETNTLSLFFQFITNYLVYDSLKERASISDAHLSKQYIRTFEKFSEEEKKRFSKFLASFIDQDIDDEPTIKEVLNLFATEEKTGDTSLLKCSEEKCSDKYCDLPCIVKSNLPLRNHQVAIVKHMLNNRGLIVSHQVGSGKTLSAVTTMQCLLKKYPKLQVIIITPKSLQANMKKEIVAYGSDPKNKRITFYTPRKFSLDFANKNMSRFKNKLLIVDEAHNLRSVQKVARRASKKINTASVIIQACQKAFKVLLLTATPIINSYADLFNLVNMIAPERLEEFQEKLRSLSNGKTFSQKTLEQVFGCLFSFFECEANEGYPSTEDHKVELVMTPEYLKKYEQVEGNQSRFYGEANLTVFYNGVRRAVNDLDKENSPKANWILDKIQEELKKNISAKFVVYSSFLDSGQMLIMKRLEKIGISYAFINGKLSGKQRDEAQKRYNKGKVKVLLISRTGGEGLDLKETNHLFLMEPGWNTPQINQVKGRVARYKSHENLPKEKQHVDIWNLFLKKPDGTETVDQYLFFMSEQKNVSGEKSLNHIRPFSIEKYSCFKDKPISLE